MFIIFSSLYYSQLRAEISLSRLDQSMPMCPVYGEQDVTVPSHAPLASESLSDGVRYYFRSSRDLVLFSTLYFEKELYFQTLKLGCSVFAFLEMSQVCMFIFLNNGLELNTHA